MIDPLPSNPLFFGAVRTVLRDFLRFEKRVAYLDIQPSNLGQALVCLTLTYDRDTLVSESPHVFGNVNVTFHKHNEGRNWRRAEFNQECWLLLLGFLNDYQTERHVQSAVGNFARVLLYEADERYLTMLLVRARVKDVRKVPQFIVYEDSEVVGGESQTVQVEVLQHHPQANGPPEEDTIPEEVDPEVGMPVDFFGLGQPVNGLNVDLNQEQDQGAQDPWPLEIQHQDQIMHEAQDLNPVPNLNVQPQPIVEEGILNLNQPPLNLHLDPVIINPVQPVQDGDFLEINDLQANEQIQCLLQHENEVFMLNPQAEEELMQLADDMHQNQQNQLDLNQIINIPHLQGSPINFMVEEVPLDQLLGSDDEDPLEQEVDTSEQHNQPQQAQHHQGQVQIQDIEQQQNQLQQAQQHQGQVQEQQLDQIQQVEQNDQIQGLADHLEENPNLPDKIEFFEGLLAENNQQMPTQQDNMQLGIALVNF